MNIAIGAFLITLLFIPAISFRLALNNHRQLKELLGALSITDTILLFILVPICTHLFLLPVVYQFGIVVKYDLILNIIYSNRDFPIVNKTMGWDVIYFLLYVLVAFGVAFIVSWFAVKNNRISRKIIFLLGVSNEWYELFNGDAEKKFDVILLDVLTSSKETTLIYSGYLKNYYFQSKSTELDYIVLTQVKRRDLRNKAVSDQLSQDSNTERYNFYKNEPGTPISLPGDLVMIPAKEILNINVTYLDLEEDSATIEE